MDFWDDSESGRFAPSGLVAGAGDSESDPAAGSDKAADESDKVADESGRFAPSGLVAGADDSESGRFAPSGLVAGADDSESDPAAGSDKAADESGKVASYIFHFSFLTMEEYFSDSMDMILPSLAPNASAS